MLSIGGVADVEQGLQVQLGWYLIQIKAHYCIHSPVFLLEKFPLLSVCYAKWSSNKTGKIP